MYFVNILAAKSNLQRTYAYKLARLSNMSTHANRSFKIFITFVFSHHIGSLPGPFRIGPASALRFPVVGMV